MGSWILGWVPDVRTGYSHVKEVALAGMHQYLKTVVFIAVKLILNIEMMNENDEGKPFFKC